MKTKMTLLTVVSIALLTATMAICAEGFDPFTVSAGLYQTDKDTAVPPKYSVRLVPVAVTAPRVQHKQMFNIILRAVIASLKSRNQLALENIALRHQLEVLQRNAKRPRLKQSDRALWTFLSRFLPDWRRHLTIVQPDTVIRWHRSGWRFYWKWKSKPGPGRPKVSTEIRALIRRMSLENPLWGAPRIHGELLKLGYDVCESTIAKYKVRRAEPPSQTWRTFIRNHMTETVAIDFLTVHTATFKTLYVLVILSLDRRRVIHFNVTANPTSEWTSLQLTQAFPFDSSPRYLIRDRDGIYGHKVINTLQALGIEQVVTAPRSPWQNGYCERMIDTIRRECLDHVIVLNEKHLRRVLKEYLAYYHESRTHLGLKKDAPVSRSIQSCDANRIVSEPVLGGLHHRYFRDAA
ncbi:MAG: putative transposase [Candidatus Krumholzibacteriia bacterium]|jgi:putative transposase